MRIAGLEKCSFVDYPGCISAVVFTPGCNLNCFYCHNRQLLTDDPLDAADPACQRYSPQAVTDLLARRRGMLDAVVVTGGEPTLQPDLEAFIASVRNMGFKVKLDTNGTNPDILESLLSKHLVDFVAMDVKAPTDLYDRICRAPVDQTAISRSVAMLLAGSITYEFRTTFAPPLTSDDIMRIALRIRGAESYVLQQYRPNPWDQAAPSYPRLLGRVANLPHDDAYIRATAEMLRPFVRHCSVRGLDTAAPTARPAQPARSRLGLTAAAQS